MTHEELKNLIDHYFDEKLSPEIRNKIQSHLDECSECNNYISELSELMKKAGQLSRSLTPPADFWNDISASMSHVRKESFDLQQQLDQIKTEQSSKEIDEDIKKRSGRAKPEIELKLRQKKDSLLDRINKPAYLISSLGLISIVAIFLVYQFVFSRASSWNVKKFLVDANEHSVAISEMFENDAIETNFKANLQIEVPKIGTLFIDEETRIQRLSGNTLRLSKGSLIADKSNAEKFLTIEIPGAEIKDFYLGGNSRVTVKNKNSVLEVMDGWSSLNTDKFKILVLPNHICSVTADSGAGLPYINGSSQEFIDAIDNYCYKNPGNEEALVLILTKAQKNNAATLWNLLERVTTKQRSMVVNTIVALLGELPSGVTRDGLSTLDFKMLNKLIEEIGAII